MSHTTSSTPTPPRPGAPRPNTPPASPPSQAPAEPPRAETEEEKKEASGNSKPQMPVPPIPPARIAATAGDPNYVPDYDPGRRSDTPSLMRVAEYNPMNLPAPVQAEGMTIPPASSMTEATALAELARLIANAKVWLAEFPYEAKGEAAEVVNFFRKLAAEQRAQADAVAHGQELPEKEEAKYVPSPEVAKLHDLSSRASQVLEELLAVFEEHRVKLEPAILDAVDGLKRELASAQ